MFSLVALVCCVAVAAASQCCIPPQWEGQTGFITTIVHNGEVTVSRGHTTMAYDAVSHRIGQYEEILLNGTAQTYGVLLDYGSDTKYIVSNNVCVKTRLGRSVDMFGGCIPDNATLLGSDDVIGFSSNDATIKSFAMYYPGITAYISMTADACVPVQETVRGTIDGNVFIQQNTYFNITAGIKDINVLQVPPKGCENAPLLSQHFTKGAFDSSIVGRRSIMGF